MILFHLFHPEKWWQLEKKYYIFFCNIICSAIAAVDWSVADLQVLET